MSEREQTVVVIEDDPAIADLLDMYLRGEGFRVLLADSGERGVEILRREPVALAVVDVGLPGIDGFEVVAQMRMWSAVPVLMLTARDAEVDRVRGLEQGADDYVTKPFSPREVMARIHAILRRGTGRPAEDLLPVGGGVVVDATRREASLDGAVVALATREFDLLHHLARNRGVALSRTQLLTEVWGFDWEGGERTVDVHVRQLRRKLGPTLPLATVWGVGYRLG